MTPSSSRNPNPSHPEPSLEKIPEERVEQEDEHGIVKRLEEVLRLGVVEEAELSEEQLRINDQLQEDELLAMESIYGENFLVLNRQNGLRMFQAYVHIETPEELILSAKLNSSSDFEHENEGSDELLYTFKVKYVPPITLTCMLPESYPSHFPPLFNLSVKWLDNASISDLCSALDSLWLEESGHEIIYQWVEWLHGSSLSFLKFDKEILLGPNKAEKGQDKRAVSSCFSPEVDIPELMSYNEKKCYEAFSKSLHVCNICFSEFVGTKFIKFPCEHFFCYACMKSYFSIHVKEGTVSKLLCPNVKCGALVPPGLLKQFLSEEEFERWETLTLQKTLESMSDIIYCPRCEIACIEDKDQHAQCSKCLFSFCTLCRERRHLGVQCVAPELKLRILQERQNSSQLKKEQKRIELELIYQLVNMKAIFRDAKQCPSCKMAISRTEGCNKMVCTNCNRPFCYRCGEAISGYDHFRNGCELFSQDTIQQWEGRMIQLERQRQLQARLQPGHGVSCPNCSQFNAKVGNNNHICCWACQQHYCYLCKKIVRKASTHFVPKGCKQHTEE